MSDMKHPVRMRVTQLGLGSPHTSIKAAFWTSQGLASDKYPGPQQTKVPCGWQPQKMKFSVTKGDGSPRSQTATSVKLSYELGKITFSTGKPKLTPGEVSTFQGF